MQIRIPCRGTTAAVATLVFLIAGGANAASITSTAFFSGTDQAMNIATDLNGTVSLINIAGVPILTIPDQSHPLSVSGGPIVVNSNPISLAIDATSDALPLAQPGALVSFDSNTWFMDGVNDLHVDLLNGQTVAGALNEITINAFILGFIPAPQPANFSFTLSGLEFWQAGSAVFTNPGAAVSQFTMPGTVRAVLSANAALGMPELFNQPVFQNQVFDIPLSLLGTASTTHVGTDDTLVAFDVSTIVTQNFNQAIDLSTITGSINPTGSIDLQATISLDLNLHLEDLITGAQILLGDITRDGRVDIGDFTLWADAFGSTGAGLSEDLSSDGRVDIGDFTLWADNFGATSIHGPAGALDASAIPEPSSLTLLGIGLAGFVAFVCRRRRAAGATR